MVSRMKLALSWVSVMIAGVALGCGDVAYPNDQTNWTLRTTPHALSDEPAGSLTFLEDGTATMFESDGVSDVLGHSDYSIDWTGTWSLDGETTTIDLGCTGSTSENTETLDCDAATLKLTCTLSNRVLDCGDYTFE